MAEYHSNIQSICFIFLHFLNLIKRIRSAYEFKLGYKTEITSNQAT